MDGTGLNQLLNRAREAKPSPLPDDFTNEVIRRTRRVEELGAIWPVLATASVFALTIAGATGLWLAKETSGPSAPPLSLFQAQPDAAPFRTP